MGRDFVVLFEEKEGTSPLVRQLDHFDAIEIVRQEGGRGWEPFDAHNCGPMRPRDFRRCLDRVYGPAPLDADALNRIYTRTAKRPLAPFDASKSVGFKTRLRPHRRVDRWLGRRRFLRAAIDAFRCHRVVVFLAVRQDVFRWALSKYHGDGSGRPGHLQFRLAARDLRRDEIPRLHVDCAAFARTLERCEAALGAKRELAARLRREGLDVDWLRYEEFCGQREALYARLLARLEIEPAPGEIERVLARGAHFEKVHSEDIREFVTNHEEVQARFGGRFVAVE